MKRMPNAFPTQPTQPALRAIALAALCLSLGANVPVRAQAAPAAAHALPLSGAAYRVAQQGYDAFARHDYAAAQRYAREAIRQRPDVASLRLLLANAEAAQGNLRAGSRTLSEAIAQLGPEPSLVARRKAFDTQIAAATARPSASRTTQASRAGRPAQAAQPGQGSPDNLTGRAFVLAQDAYRAYDAKDYARALREANAAIALRPDVLRLRLLAIDAAMAQGEDAAAWQLAQDAAPRFGNNAELRARRSQIGARLAPKFAAAAQDAQQRGDLAGAATQARAAIAYAPDRIGYRLQLFGILIDEGDMPALDAAASDALSANITPTMMLHVMRGYARAAQGQAAQADADFTQALQADDGSARERRVARVIVADVWTAQGEPQRALDLLKPLGTQGDDTDAWIAARRYTAREALARSTPESAQQVASEARPVLDCAVDASGAACDVYAADAGFAARRASILAAQRGDKEAAVHYARAAVDAAPRNPQHRVELIDALVAAGDPDGARCEARAALDAGLLDAMPPLSAAYLAQRVGADRRAFEYFVQADEAGQLPPQAAGDAGYSAYRAWFDSAAARYLERAVDYGTAPPDGVAPATLLQLQDLRNVHADVTRDWGFIASINYRGAGLQPGVTTGSVPGAYNNWQMGVEGYWRPFGSLGDRNFEVYARAYQDFGAKGGAPSGVSTALGAIGMRAKPFESINAVIAFERLIPIGSHAPSDWLVRLAYSGGFGTERRLDVPSWWTVQDYAEVGHYVSNGWNYATGYLEAGRTWRLDRISPKLTVFPYGVIGMDYDSSINHSVPVGMGVGVSTRYWFRDTFYDSPRSYVDVSVQYRWRLTGDDRAGGVFFGAVLSY
ncbi:NfrA family protein [Paraburkholderia tropica]|uniref:NfrA family protein n=2 Tax=Paraburkholderia tropica TaxID=92647 RepID=UPI002AB1C0F4|nr:bacteriophage N4 adsorption protein A [Paraburkholderia tropica]